MSLETVPYDAKGPAFGSRKHSSRVLLGLNAVSLDAPLVCLGWLWLMVTPGYPHPSGTASLVLFLSVWLAYMADRWFDTWRLKKPGQGSHRHRFVHRHRKFLAIIWVAIFLFSVILALDTLDPTQLRNGFLLLALVLTYFAAIHLGPTALRHSIPREIATTCILLSGIFLFLPHPPQPHTLTAALGLLFIGNCALIGHWESRTDRAQGFGSLARHFPASIQLIRLGLAFLAVFGASMIVSGGAGPLAPVWSALALSALALLTLDLTSHRRESLTLPALADIALMSPWIVLPIQLFNQ